MNDQPTYQQLAAEALEFYCQTPATPEEEWLEELAELDRLAEKGPLLCPAF